MATLNRNPIPILANPSKAALKKNTPSAVTPPKDKDLGLERHMTVDKNIVDELLLVCGVIGTTTETSSKGVDSLVPVTDCLNWLQDLQRALRRDEDLYRPISLLMGKWNVVQKKLLPLVLTCRYDTPMVLTIVKILVILTKPLHENTMRAGRLVIDTKSKKANDEVIEEQKKLRENALIQNKMLMDYKKAIVHHPSHRRSKDNPDADEGGLLSIFVSLLAEPLSKTGSKRTDADHLTIELVLHLFRNILSAEPIVKGSQDDSAQLHNECIALFERELVLEILLVICQEMELRENAQYNLLMMELLHHLLKTQDPTAIARCMSADENSQSVPKSNTSSKTASSNPTADKNRAPNGMLRTQLARDRQHFRSRAPARHGNFGGTLMLKRQGGKHEYVSASAVLDCKTDAASQADDLAGPKRRRNRKTEPFIGSGRTLLAHTVPGKLLNFQRGPAAQRAQKTLHRFCQRFMDKCYGPVMKSLKNEFRRDSVRLDGEQDKVILFRIIWFFFQWFRVSGFGKLQQEAAQEKPEDEKEAGKTNTALGQLIFTMDVFSFNLVLNAASTFLDAKKFTRLAQTVALYSEMMHMLHSMYHSKDSTEQLMALGLMDRLFYGSDPVDCLPRLLSKWVPGTTTREYVCDLVELCHITMKLLDANQKACVGIRESEETRLATVIVKGKKKTKVQTNDAVLQMKLAAADFDPTSYFIRKIIGNQVVFLYTKLLEQYEFNAPQVNHRIVAFFLRLSKVKLNEEEEEIPQPALPLQDRNEPLVNLLAPKKTTLEPMLYNMHMITVLNRILNDPLIAKDQTYSTLRSWAAGIVHNFANLAATNPVLFVEVLFKHPFPHRFCLAATNAYVSEELQMIAQKSLLLEAQRLEMMNNDHSDEEGYDDCLDDEELEFVDAEIDLPVKAVSSKRRKTDSDDSSESGEKLSSKKRRLQSKTSTSNLGSDGSDDELEFETTPTLTSDDNDKGRIKNKGKLKRKAFDDSSDEEAESPASPSKPTMSVSRKSLSFADSSDEEGDSKENSGDASAKKTSKPSRKPASFSDDDSSDEEGADSRKDRESKKRAEVKQMRKAILDDDSSDEDEGGTRDGIEAEDE